METTIMKNLVLLSVCSFVGIGAFGEASVDRILVRQQWPWSSEVRVDYEVSGAEGVGVDLVVEVKAEAVTLDTAAVNQAMVGGSIHGVKNGYGYLSFDPVKAFGTEMTSREISVKLTVGKAADPLVDRLEYRVFDLVTGKVTDLRRRDFFDLPSVYGNYTTNYATIGSGFSSPLENVFVWTGVNADEYKTTKLVMKRIPAANAVFYMGPHDDDTLAVRPGGSGNYFETRLQTKLTKDFFIGVFEVTQRQHELLTGRNPSYFTNVNYYAMRPLENIGQHDVMNAETGLCQRANAKFTGHTFKLPTEAQWEFAVKAGYDGPNYPNGKEVTLENFAELEGYSYNYGYSSRNENLSNGGTRHVGIGRPNAYGLYNTLGNMQERTRDQVQGNLYNYWTNQQKKTEPVVDPAVNSSSVGVECYSVKGGNWHWTSDLKRSRPSYRYGYVPAQVQDYGCYAIFGYRLVCE